MIGDIGRFDERRPVNDEILFTLEKKVNDIDEDVDNAVGDLECSNKLDYTNNDLNILLIFKRNPISIFNNRIFDQEAEQ